MPYAYEQEVPIDEETYAKIMQRIGDEPIAGQLVHLAVRVATGRLRYIDVWTSKAACERAIVERIHPAVSHVFREIGFRPKSEPPRQEMDLIHILGVATREAAP